MRIFADCPKCQSNLTYQDGGHFVCAECTHEWPEEGTATTVIVASTLPVRSSSKALINAIKDRGSSLWRTRKPATWIAHNHHSKTGSR